MIKYFFSILVCGIILSGCTKSVKSEILEAPRANEKAKSLLEWDSAAENPKNIFQRLRGESSSKSELSREVCEGLGGLNGKDLSLFEEEINKEENRPLLKDCRDTLKKTLDGYWQEQKKSLESAG